MEHKEAWIELKDFVSKTVEDCKARVSHDIEAGISLKPFEKMLAEMNHIEMKMVANTISEITKEDMSYAIYSERDKGNE